MQFTMFYYGIQKSEHLSLIDYLNHQEVLLWWLRK